MNIKNKHKYAVPALDKTLDIFEFLVQRATPCSQSEIATGINRTANEIYRILVGLEGRGYLLRDQHSGRYSMSLKLYHLSRNISPIDHVRQSALPYMEDLVVNLGQSCYLTMLYQSQSLTVIQASSHSAMHLSVAEGAMFALNQSTAGKLLLANSNTQVRRMLIEHDPVFCQLNQSKLDSLYSELDVISLQGQLTQRNPLISDVDDFSVLVGKPEAKLIAALTISSFDTPLISVANKQLVLTELNNAAEKISSLLQG